MAKARPPKPLSPVPSSEFRRDLKRLKKQGKDLEKLAAILTILCARQALAVHHRDHALVGNWAGCRECHVEGYWLLIYAVDGDDLALVRSGSHAELFAKYPTWPIAETERQEEIRRAFEF